MSNCEFCGCVYNEDGRCVYDESEVKVEYAKACCCDSFTDYYEGE